MNNSIHLRYHVLIVGSLLLLVITLRFAFPKWYIADQKRIVAKAEMERARDIEHYWSSFHYANIGEKSFSDLFVQKIDWSTIQISEIQRSRLTARLKQMVAYFANPSVDSYCGLMTDGVHFNFTLNSKAILAPDPSNTLVVAHLATEPRACLQELRTHNLLRQYLSPATAFSGVCLDKVLVNLSFTNMPNALLKGKPSLGFTIGVEPLNPGFSYPANSSNGTNASDQVNFQINFLAKVKTSGNVGPVAVNLTWLPQDQNWAVTRLIYNRWLNISTLF